MNTASSNSNPPEQLESIKLRSELLREPLGLLFSDEELAAEIDQYHLGALDDGEVVAILLLVDEGEAGVIRMRQVAVAEDRQGQGIGHELVRFSERFAREKGYREMTLHAREGAVGFYRSMDYDVVSNRFSEVGIPSR